MPFVHVYNIWLVFLYAIHEEYDTFYTISEHILQYIGIRFSAFKKNNKIK